MNLRILTWTASLALAVTHSFAREPQAPPSPGADAAPRAGIVGKGPDGASLFVGHYGEAIQLPSGWTAEAEMKGETEVVYFHPKFHDEFGFKPFRPKKSDYKPENFSPMGLIELIAIPKNAPGGLRNLAAIRSAKEQEMKQQGFAYEISSESGAGDWPRGTFHVRTDKPYRLWQTYSESTREFYILTYGGGVEVGNYGLDERRVLNFSNAMQVVSRSLSDHLTQLHKKTLVGVLFHASAVVTDDIFSVFREYYSDPGGHRLLGILAIGGAFMTILAAWPGQRARARRVRLFGRSLLFFSATSGFAGFIVIYIPARFGGVSWNSDEVAALVPVLFLPWIGWAAARGLGSAYAKRVLAASGGLAVLWAILLLSNADLNNTDPVSILAFENTIFLLIIGLTFGFTFTLTFGPLPEQKVSR